METADTPRTQYDLFLVDPPWPKKKGGLRAARPNQGRELDYTTMTVPEIFILLDKDLFQCAAAQHSVFLWAVDEFLFDAEWEMRQRGYKRHARLIWDKENGVAPAFSIRYSHEYLLWFYKPKFSQVSAETQGKFTTVLRERARQHSRKPEIAFTMLEQMFPNAIKMDAFSRQTRPGWDSYGNQVTYFD